MPSYDYRCDCGAYAEDVFFKLDEKPDVVICPVCNENEMKQVPAIGVIIGDEAAWLKSVTEVVDRDGGVHCQKFIQDPTRENYREWMKKEGLRPMEPGEGGWRTRSDKEKQDDRAREVKRLVENHKKRTAIRVS